jgi:hypothetical protein
MTLENVEHFQTLAEGPPAHATRHKHRYSTDIPHPFAYTDAVRSCTYIDAEVGSHDAFHLDIPRKFLCIIHRTIEYQRILDLFIFHRL